MMLPNRMYCSPYKQPGSKPRNLSWCNRWIWEGLEFADPTEFAKIEIGNPWKDTPWKINGWFTYSHHP